MPRFSFQDWLWRGSFEIHATALAVWEGDPARGDDPPTDLVHPATSYLRELWRLADLAEEIERRGRGESTAELRGLARSMLPVLDALDRVVDYGMRASIPGEEFQNWLKAVEGVSLRLSRVMEGIGLSPISVVGTEVDLNVHDVVATVQTTKYPENTIVEERQKGYYFKGRLLRDAKVVVAVSQ